MPRVTAPPAAAGPGSLLDLVPVMPVVVLHDLSTAVPLARALLAGGLPVLELTLRTPQALAAIALIAAEVPGVLVGAGTVLTPADVEASVDAGAHFLVTPGSPTALLDALDASGLPSLPGAATATEVMTLADRGRHEVKLFPAAAVGGPAYLAALGGPLPGVRFCPTGGITPATAPDYLALPNVGCVGGSWLTPADALASGDWARVEALARQAATLGRGA